MGRFTCHAAQYRPVLPACLERNMPIAELVIIGSEFLLGEALDTNSRTLARALRDLGLELRRIQTVGDDVTLISQAVRSALSNADIVITSGGLGPTVDDPTRQAIATALGVTLEFRPELWEQVTARLARYGRIPSENQRQQACVPRGAIAIENPVGTAPAFLLERGHQTVIALPGVPRELETLLLQYVIPYLQRRYDIHATTRVRTLHVAGLGESAVDERIGEFERGTNPTVGLAAHAGLIDVRLVARAATRIQADELLWHLEHEIRQRLGEAVFGADEETLEAVTLNALRERGWTLAVCEVGLDGALLERLAPFRGNIYRGGEQVAAPFSSLKAITARLQRRYQSQIALGLWLRADNEKHILEFWLKSPVGERSGQFSYGGHPASAPQWASNMALDCLRRFLLEQKTS